MKKRLYLLLSLVVTIGIFAWLFSHVSLSDVVQLLRNADRRGVALFLATSLTMSVFRCWRYLLLLRASGYSPGRGAMFLVVLVRNTFSDFLPARIGSLVYIYVITTRLGVPFGAASSSFALAFIFDILAIVPLIILAALGLGGASLWAMLGLGVVLTVLMAIVLAVLPQATLAVRGWVGRLTFLGPKRMAALQASLQSVVDEWRVMRATGTYIKLFVLSLMVRVFKYASLYMFLFALVAPLGYGFRQLPVPQVFTGLCAAEAAASLPISGIAGFGTYEGAWAFVFQMLLFPASLAKTTSIAHHVFTQIYGYSIGGIALLVLLLPVWRRVLAPRPQPPETMLRFGVKLAALFSGFVLLAVLLYRVIAQPGLATAPIVRAPSEAEAAGLAHLSAQMDAWVVFERPDGIYTLKVGETEPSRLQSAGGYPRWSPDGQQVAFIQNGQIMRIRRDGSQLQSLATVGMPRALAWHPSGDEIYFTDDRRIRAVHLLTGESREVVSGWLFRELDVATDGSLVATVRTRGVAIMGFDPASGRQWRVADGCSASLSPDGRLVTNNRGDHRTLAILDVESGEQKGLVNAPRDHRFDNQFWSNRHNWLASRSEGPLEEVFVHDLSKNEAVRVTFVGQCDRPDLFVESVYGVHP